MVNLCEHIFLKMKSIIYKLNIILNKCSKVSRYYTLIFSLLTCAVFIFGIIKLNNKTSNLQELKVLFKPMESLLDDELEISFLKTKDTNISDIKLYYQMQFTLVPKIITTSKPFKNKIISVYHKSTDVDHFRFIKGYDIISKNSTENYRIYLYSKQKP